MDQTAFETQNKLVKWKTYLKKLFRDHRDTEIKNMNRR